MKSKDILLYFALAILLGLVLFDGRYYILGFFSNKSTEVGKITIEKLDHYYLFADENGLGVFDNDEALPIASISYVHKEYRELVTQLYLRHGNLVDKGQMSNCEVSFIMVEHPKVSASEHAWVSIEIVLHHKDDQDGSLVINYLGRVTDLLSFVHEFAERVDLK